MNIPIRIAAVVAVQLALVGVAVAPQLSARATGDEYLFRVAPVDPVDPFRGAYVALDYPDVYPAGEDHGDGTVFVTLVEKDGLWVRDAYTTTRPADGPYLACDDHGWQLRCGIESWFLPQDEAATFQQWVADDEAVARVRIDARGHAALVAVEHR
ncbi:MAG: GDYXXLXY domain-containing protein [Nocardioidaceae bacterium]